MKKQIEDWLTDSGSENAESAAGSKINVSMERVLRWMFFNLTPVLMIAQAINLLIIFNAPIEMTMSSWFCFKDPLSIAVAFILFRYCRKFLRVNKTN